MSDEMSRNLRGLRSDLEVQQSLRDLADDLQGRAAAEIGRLREALKGASHALRSYQYGNASTELAEAQANAIDAILSSPPLQGGEALTRGVTRYRGQPTEAQIKRDYRHHVALVAEKVRDHTNYGTVHNFAGTLSAAPRTYFLFRSDLNHVVFCFKTEEDAKAFSERFGGELLPVK